MSGAKGIFRCIYYRVCTKGPHEAKLLMLLSRQGPTSLPLRSFEAAVQARRLIDARERKREGKGSAGTKQEEQQGNGHGEQRQGQRLHSQAPPSHYLRGTKREELVAPMPGRPCWTGL